MQVDKWAYKVNGMTLAERIKIARKHAGLTQRQLAEAARVEQPLISQLETGKTLKTAHIAQLAKACRVSALWLASGEGVMAPSAITADGTVSLAKPWEDLQSRHADYARTLQPDADVEQARTILQNIHALIEYKCPDRELGGLARLTGIPLEELHPIVTLARPTAELDDLAERIEIALKMPKGAMTNGDPASKERRHLIRYLLDELPGLDPFIAYEVRLLAALSAIKKASDEGRATIATVHALEKIVDGLPSEKQNPPQNWSIPRTQTSKDKEKDQPDSFWF